MYDFDTVRHRQGMNSSKWDSAIQKGCPPDIVPLSVADMEFQTAPEVIQAVTDVAQFGMWGYTYDGDDFKNAIAGWMEKRHGWKSENSWMVHVSGVVHGVFAAVRAFTQPEDGVVVQTPVYYPFYSAVEKTGRKLLKNPLRRVGDRYEIDFDNLRVQLQQASMMIFCSPHNPVGRVWRPEEVEEVARLCEEAGVLLFSDEIHCDLTMPGHPHFSVGRLPAPLRYNAIIATSACKTFSLAGLACGTLFVPDAAKQKQLQKRLAKDGYFFNNTFGIAATRTAYLQGEGWLNALLPYLYENYRFLQTAIAERVPGVRVLPLEGTYLAWLDCTGLGLSDEKLLHLMEKDAQLYLDEGTLFGDGGEGHTRVNLACPRSVLEGAVDRLAAAVANQHK